MSLEKMQTIEKPVAEFRVLFGGCNFAVSSSCAAFMAMVADRYPLAAWDDGAELGGSCRYTVSGPTQQSAENLFEGRKAPVTFRALVNGDWEIESRQFYGHFDAEKRHLALVGPLAVFPLDLACLVLWYTLNPNGFIVHGAGLCFDGAYWLCSGPSGSGKSTLAKLFPSEALCDEFCGVLVQDEPQMVSLPFWENKPGGGKLAGIFMLQHALENRRTALTQERRFQSLASQVYWPYFDEALTQRTLAHVARLINCTSVEDLGFLPTKAVATMFGQSGGAHA